MNKKTKLTYLFIPALAVLLLFLFFTSPDRLPLYALFVPFVTIYILSYVVFSLLADALLGNLRTSARRWLAISLAALPVTLLILQSSGQIGQNDALLFIALVILLIFYFRKADFLK